MRLKVENQTTRWPLIYGVIVDGGDPFNPSTEAEEQPR